MMEDVIWSCVAAGLLSIDAYIISIKHGGKGSRMVVLQPQAVELAAGRLKIAKYAPCCLRSRPAPRPAAASASGMAPSQLRPAARGGGASAAVFWFAPGRHCISQATSRAFCLPCIYFGSASVSL